MKQLPPAVRNGILEYTPLIEATNGLQYLVLSGLKTDRFTPPIRSRHLLYTTPISYLILATPHS